MPNGSSVQGFEKGSNVSLKLTDDRGASTIMSESVSEKDVSLGIINRVNSPVTPTHNLSNVGEKGSRFNDGLEEVSNDTQENESQEEMDLAEASEEESEELDLGQLAKLNDKNKKSLDGSEQFSKAVNSILDSKLKAYDRKDPILARSKKGIKKLEEEKLERKAMRLLLQEKKERLRHSRNVDVLPTNDDNARTILERERAFKKIAQKGAIRLFNAILATQVKTYKIMEDTKTDVLGHDARKRAATEVSKDSFLDMIQRAGKNTHL